MSLAAFAVPVPHGVDSSTRTAPRCPYEVRRRRTVVVNKYRPRGLDGLSQAREWKGLSNDELRKAGADEVDAGALRRHLNRGLADRKEDSVVSVFQYACRVKSTAALEEMPYSEAHAIVAECMKKRMWSGGLAALEYLETFYAPVRKSTYAVAAGGLARLNRVIELRDMVYRLLRPQESGTAMPRPDERLCALAANVAVENNRLQMAVEITEEMEAFGIELTPLTYSILIKGFGRRRRPLDIKRQLMKMKEKGVRGDLVLYNSAIDAFVRNRMLKLAETVVQRMREKGVEPDHVSYNSLLKGLIKENRLREAFQLTRQMEERGLRVDDVARNTLLHGCTKLNRFDDALRILDEIASIKDNGRGRREGKASDIVVAYTSIVSGLASKGDLAAAGDFLQRMKEHEVAPNVVTYTSLISGALECGELAQAWATFRAMERDGIKADHGTFKAMIAGLCAKGGKSGVVAAQKLLGTMQQRGIEADADVYNMIINGHVKSRDMSGAEHTVAMMKRAAVELDVVTFTTLLKGYGRERNMREVRKVFLEMRTRGIEPDIYSFNTFLASCVRSGDVTLAYRVFREGIQEKQTPDVYTYTTIMSGLVYEGRGSEAWKLYESMKRRGILPNARSVDTLMRYVATSPALDSTFGVREARILFQDARAVGVAAEKLRTYEELVRNLEYMTSETWKQRGEDVDEVSDEVSDDGSASNRIFRDHDWNRIDSSFKII